MNNSYSDGRESEPTKTIARLSRYLWIISIILIAISCIYISIIWESKPEERSRSKFFSSVPLAVGTSIMASMIVQEIHGRIVQERMMKKIAEDSATAAISYAQDVLSESFTNVVPKKTYPRTQKPLLTFRNDMAEQLRHSKQYRHKGDAASFAGFRLTKLAAHPVISSKEQITLCILDPREDRLLYHQARQKLRTTGARFSREDIQERASKIREEIFITLVAMFDIAHLVRVNVALHKENLFFRSEIFEQGVFVSYYLGGSYPGTYFFDRNTHVFAAFMLNFAQILDFSEYNLHFGDEITEQEFLQHLQALKCPDSIEALRKKRDTKYSQYENSLVFPTSEPF